MPVSFAALLVMGALFVLIVYLAGYVRNRVIKSKTPTGDTFKSKGKWATALSIISILAPVVVGIILVNTVFVESRANVKSIKKRPNRTNLHRVVEKRRPPQAPPILKLIVSDGSLSVEKAIVHNECKKDELILVRDGNVTCGDPKSPLVKAYLAQQNTNLQMLEPEHPLDEELKKKLYREIMKKALPNINYAQDPPRLDDFNVMYKYDAGFPPMVHQQGFLLNIPATNGKKKPKQPFKDRHAEIFYFLALVAGVLGKYFWDYFEAKEDGENVQFNPHRIVLAFIIAMMVYYSIQQGLENEAGTFTWRGVVFAFNNGFMWQAIIKPNVGNRGQEQTPEENEA